MNYCIVFLNYDPDGTNAEMAQQSRQSLGGVPLFEVKNVKGFVHAVNEGLKQDADYYIFVANDVLMEDPDWIKKMTHEDALVGWRFNKFFLTGENFPDFACFALSRKVRDTIGFMDIEYAEGYGFDDNDYCYRAKDAGFELIDAGVKLKHLENKTYSTYFSKEKEAMTERNQALFVKKWLS